MIQLYDFYKYVYTRMNKTVLPMGYLCWRREYKVFPFGPFVLFLYQSFGKNLVWQLVTMVNPVLLPLLLLIMFIDLQQCETIFLQMTCFSSDMELPAHPTSL